MVGLTKCFLVLIFVVSTEVFASSLNYNFVKPDCSFLQKECLQAEGLYPIYKALPNCSFFCQCSNGQPYLHICPHGLHFNPTLNACDYPEKAGCRKTGNSNDTNSNNVNNTDTRSNVSRLCEKSSIGCPDVDEKHPDYRTESIITNNKQINSSNVCSTSGISCPPVDGLHPVYGSVSNYSQFCQCSNGKAYLYECPGGLHFNIKLNVCDLPSRAALARNENTTNNENKAVVANNNSNNACQIFGNVCSANNTPLGVPVFFSVPTNCSQYCQCLNRKPYLYLYTCPENQCFDDSLGLCLWSASVDGTENDDSDENVDYDDYDGFDK